MIKECLPITYGLSQDIVVWEVLIWQIHPTHETVVHLNCHRLRDVNYGHCSFVNNLSWDLPFTMPWMGIRHDQNNPLITPTSVHSWRIWLANVITCAMRDMTQLQSCLESQDISWYTSSISTKCPYGSYFILQQMVKKFRAAIKIIYVDLVTLKK